MPPVSSFGRGSNEDQMTDLRRRERKFEKDREKWRWLMRRRRIIIWGSGVGKKKYEGKKRKENEAVG